MTSLHVICDLGPPQSKILATPMLETGAEKEINEHIQIQHFGTDVDHELVKYTASVVIAIRRFPLFPVDESTLLQKCYTTTTMESSKNWQFSVFY